jgi:hypothetical protein
MIKLSLIIHVLIEETYRQRWKDYVDRMLEDKWPKMAWSYLQDEE